MSKQEEALVWKTLGTKALLHTPVYDVVAQTECAPNGLQGEYVAINAPDWVMTIPVYQGCFVMVRQWRHSADRLTTEFPGGVVDAGEDPAATARRELLEETGFQAGKLTHLGSCSPNPALFKNTFHCYLAEELTPTGTQHLDADELLRYQLIPIDEVINAFGSPEYTHALMGTALAFYLRRERMTTLTEEKLMLKRVATTKAPAAIGPYSQAVWAGDFLYLSGMMPIDPETGALEPSEIRLQAKRIMKNVEAVLAEAGLTEANVVKTTCFLADMADFAAFNEVYGGYFVSKPARSCVAVRELPKGALVEVEVIAYRG